ncbi:hypothetical protein COHA_003478 [Chlorella ohadii]|uniref:Phosphate transporter n=1 Tax=Chlorella ohadii TaxID=2649997 RepID=A0AAD5DRZ7_9CHLO|nr:hypothetical protein COHA_003478 [Chlorella ohadii]
MVYAEFTWIFVCSIFLALFVAYGIGANDVANAFGSSVGAKALTMKQAIVIAAICEFGGAVLLGAGVTSTIRSNIANLNDYRNKPDLYMYGMLCALLATGIWLIVATYFELPVSTTHSIVGAVIGMSMVAAGPDSVVWSREKDSFPYLEGVSVIVISWFTSPLLAGIGGAILFLFTRHAVLRRKNSYVLSLWMLPLFTFLTVWIGCFYIIQKGPKLADKVDNSKNAWISTCFAAGGALIAGLVGVPLIKRQVTRDWDELCKAEVIPELRGANTDAGKSVKDTDSDSGSANAPGTTPTANDAEGVVGAGHPERTPAPLRDLRKSRIYGALTKSSNFDIHGVISEDEKVHDLHANGEQFDKKTELSFKYLQVFTAMCNSFAHGSNDVANAVGPFAGIYAVWQCTCVNSRSDVPVWILVIGGVGLVVGLATYGYKIMRVLGVKMTKLTNSRGYCVELAAAAIIILGSRYGLPLSTTHCMVGAVTGIGVVEAVSGRRPEGATSNRAFNWLLLAKFFLGWVATLVIAAATSAAFTAQGVYAPFKTDTDQRVADSLSLNTTANAVAANLSSLATATGSEIVGNAATVIAEACSAAMVPRPPVSFDAISACVNTAMVTLNTTVFGVTAA